jgi:hypothetical protein
MSSLQLKTLPKQLLGSLSLNISLPETSLPPIYTNSGASDFCHVRPILPGFRPIFEIGIFLSLRLILCNSCPILSQRFQMKLSLNLWTKNFPVFFNHEIVATLQNSLKLSSGQYYTTFFGSRSRLFIIS